MTSLGNNNKDTGNSGGGRNNEGGGAGAFSALAGAFGGFVRRRSDRIADSEAQLAQAEATSKRRVEQFLDAMPIGVFVATADGHPYYANQEAQRLLGQGIIPGAGQEELAQVYRAYAVGTNELYPVAAMPLVRALSGDSSHVDDMEIRKPEGNVPVEVWGTPVGDGDEKFAIATFMDVSERRRATQEVQFLSAITASMSEGVVLVRAADSTIAYANASYAAMFGYEPGELVGRSVVDLTAPDFAESGAVLGIREALRAQGTWRGEIHGLRKDGTTLWCEVNVTGLDDPAQGPAWIAVNTDITARREAQEAQARLASIVQATTDAILSKTLDGILTSWNPGAEAMFGYNAAEMVGGPIEVLIPPEARAEEAALRDRVARGLGIEQHETVRLRKDGTSVHVSTTLSPIEDADRRVVGIATIWRDITDRKRAEEADRRRTARDVLLARAVQAMAPASDLREAFVSFVEVVRTEVACERASLAVQSGNSEMRILVVVGPDGWRIPQGQALLIDDANWQRYNAGLSATSSDTTASTAGLDRALAKAGIRSYVSVPIVAAGEVRALISFSSSYPGHFPPEVVPVLDAVVRETAGTFNTVLLLDRERETASRLRELDALKSEFVSTVAHDLRSPMTVIAGFAEMLQLDGEEMAAAEREAVLGRIMANITRLSDLVGDVLDVARIDSGDFKYELAPFDLAASMRRTVEEAAIAQSDRECRMVVPDNLPQAFGDEDRYWRVMANLLSNAFKFSPKAAPVEVSICEHGHELEVRVRDYGSGIDPDEVPRLFGKFSRVAQRGPGPKAPGTGLGLYISKHLVEGQGGRMWVETVPDQGSSFFFTVPTARGRT